MEPRQLFGYGRSDWSSKLTRGLAILVNGVIVETMSTTWNRACFRLRMPFWPVIMIMGIAPSRA